jgi:deoxyribodipyrimidine photo-lyase
MNDFPELRLRRGNRGEVNTDGDYVLYWMIAFRRTEWNFSLQRAVDWARELNKPLVVFEPLRCDYQWASDRLHHFVIQGMAVNAKRLARKPVLYYPYVEPVKGDSKGLIASLAARACVVVGDDYPGFFLPRLVTAAAGKIPARFELVDSNGILPLRAADKVFARAYDFRRFLQKQLRPHLLDIPIPDPLSRIRLPRLKGLPTTVREKWPAADVNDLAAGESRLQHLPIDHTVTAVPTPGGAIAAQKQLHNFLKENLVMYDSDRNQPQRDVTSGLSPYLHFGHVSAHQVLAATMEQDSWSPTRLAAKATGSAHDWWGASSHVESFLDELITWRELGYNMCWQRSDYDQYESLPDWARRTLADHAEDPREHLYSLEDFETANTHDALWNAAQRQLVLEGRIHNYLRMLWGKKILEWSESPQHALEIMIELNNKFALDGRDPNSYSGIFWVLGRYDRAWGPERPIFGKVRYMSSQNTARKVRVKDYIEKYGPSSLTA